MAGFGRLRRESCLSPGQRASAGKRLHVGHSDQLCHFLKADIVGDMLEVVVGRPSDRPIASQGEPFKLPTPP